MKYRNATKFFHNEKLCMSSNKFYFKKKREKCIPVTKTEMKKVGNIRKKKKIWEL